MENLSTEISKEKDALLAACLTAFNEIGNHRLEHNRYSSTDALAHELDKMLSLIRLQKQND